MNSDVINEHYYGDPANPATERARERIHWICKQVTGRDVLDIGCSQGIVCLILGREGFCCTGIDIESASLTVGEKALTKEDEIVRQRVTLKLADATQLPFPNESFDTVILGEILEHLIHPDKVIAEAKRVLRTGGCVVVTVPYGLNAFPDHKRTYYPISLLELLQPLFRTSFIQTLGNYITYTGVKDAAHDIACVTKESLFDQYLQLEKALEERCLAKELALLDTATKLYAQIKELTEQSEEKDRRIQSAEEALAAKGKQAGDLDTDLQETRVSMTELRNSAARAQTELDGHASRIKELQETVAARENRIRDLEADIEQRSASATALSERVVQTESASAAQAGKTRELQETLAERETRVGQLNADLERERASNSTLSERMIQAEAGAATLASRVKEIQEGLIIKESRVKDLELELEKARASLATLSERLIHAEVTSTTQASKATEIQEAIASKERRTKELEVDLEKARSSLGALGERVVQTESKLAAQRRRTKELENSIAAKDRQIGRLEYAIEQEREKSTGLHKELAEAQSNQTQLHTDAAKATSTLAALELKLAALQSEHTQTQKELATKSAAGQQQLARMEALHIARLQEREKQHDDLLKRREGDWKRRVANQRVREIARLFLPPEARVLVISKGDDDLLNLDGRRGLHFPQMANGVYLGHHPADAAEAVKHLEALKGSAEFLLIPASSFWWLEYYADFRRHLESSYRLLTYNHETCIIYALSSPAPELKNRLTLSVQDGAAKSSTVRTEAQPTSQATLAAPQVPLPTNGSTPPAVPNPVSSGTSLATKRDTTAKPPGGKLRVGCVLDQFTSACFEPECELITFRPDSWKGVLDHSQIDLLFVESAWHGNGGSWQYKVASYKKPMGEELVDLITYCKERKIPTVFWNKEDPSHFDRFIHRASLFDFVFTSDSDMIPKYRGVVKHDRVFALPFAAQPKIHYPIVETDRPHRVCFAGAYYALDHDERRADMDHLLRPALSYGLHIYDRQQGVVGTNAQAFQFPEIYQPAIRGRLEYDQMVEAYKWYKVFLNVNSVKQSPTMFSRRVFELLASGTPVISSYSKGIVALLGKETVHIAQTEEETKNCLERLLKDQDYWSEVAVKGIRQVLSQHTYAHRLAEICRNVGLPLPTIPQAKIAAFALVDTVQEITRLTKMLASQTYRHFDLTVLARKNIVKVDALKAGLPDIEVRILPSTTRFPEPLLQAPESSYLWLVNLEDGYGDNFLQDAALATVYSDAEVIGKLTHLEFGPEAKRPKLIQSGQEFRYVKSVSPGSVIAKAGRLTSEQWKALAANRMIDLLNLRVLSIDRFNYVRSGGKRASNPFKTLSV